MSKKILQLSSKIENAGVSQVLNHDGNGITSLEHKQWKSWMTAIT